MPTRITAGQLQLFQIGCRELADEIGLNWWAAKKLYDDKWLSFDPETDLITDCVMEAEFRFLGSLVAAGCDPRMLERMLLGLEKPYSYNLSYMYYDWERRCWEDMPYLGDREDVAKEMIQELDERGNTEALMEIEEHLREALGRPDEEAPGKRYYCIEEADSSIIASARKMLWKLAASPLADSPTKVLVLGKLFHVLQRMPEVTLGESLSISLGGPTRQHGNHEISHHWSIELDTGGFLEIGSGGYFSRPETGGDSFTSLSWSASPGGSANTDDYLDSLSLVDDADTFEHEVEAMDFDAEEYELSVWAPSLEDMREEPRRSGPATTAAPPEDCDPPQAVCHLTERKRFDSADDFTFGSAEHLLRESHIQVSLTRCERCGQVYAACWLEIVDWSEGNDDQWSFWVPVDEAQEADIRADPMCVIELIQSNAHIKWHPNGEIYWTELPEMAFDMGP